MPIERNRPVVQVTLSPEARDMVREMAEARGLSVSALVELLIREEARRDRRKA